MDGANHLSNGSSHLHLQDHSFITTAWNHEPQNGEQSIDECSQVQNVDSREAFMKESNSNGSCNFGMDGQFVADTETLPLTLLEQEGGEEQAAEATSLKRPRQTSSSSPDRPLSAQQLRRLRETPEERERRLVEGRERTRLWRERRKSLPQAGESTSVDRAQETPDQVSAVLGADYERCRILP